jgi:hypothetical protein
MIGEALTMNDDYSKTLALSSVLEKIYTDRKNFTVALAARLATSSALSAQFNGFVSGLIGGKVQRLGSSVGRAVDS